MFRLLVVGKCADALQPVIAGAGFVVEAQSTVEGALAALERQPRHLVFFSLDASPRVLLRRIHEDNLAGATVVVDVPRDAAAIVDLLSLGVDGYLPLPAPEDGLFRVLERHLMAQWALADDGRVEALAAEKQRAERDAARHRKMVAELALEVNLLRQRLLAAASDAPGKKQSKRTVRSGSGPGLAPGAKSDMVTEGAEAADNAIDNSISRARTRIAPATVLPVGPAAGGGSAQFRRAIVEAAAAPVPVSHDETAPRTVPGRTSRPRGDV